MSTFFIILLSIGITWITTDMFRKGRELNKIVIAFSKMHLLLNELTPKMEISLDEDEYKEELFFLAYLFRREIILRLDQYKWSMNTPLMIPGISNKRIVLGNIFHDTINRLLSLGEKIGCEFLVRDIIDGKDAYYELDRALPNYVKNRI